MPRRPRAPAASKTAVPVSRQARRPPKPPSFLPTPAALQHYAQQLLEPVVPFVTPGPAAYVSASNIASTTIRNTSNRGFAIIEPSLNRFLTQPSEEPSLLGWISKATALCPDCPPSSQVTLDELLECDVGTVSMASVPFSTAGYLHSTHNGMLPGGKYYPGSWSLDGLIRFNVSVTRTSDVTVRIFACDAEGPLGYPLATETVTVPQTGSVPIGIQASFSVTTGIAIVLSFTGPTNTLRSDVYSPALTKLPGVLTRVTPMALAIDGASSRVDDLSTATRIKCSALSFMTTNGSADNVKGGFISGAWFPAGTYDQLPLDWEGLNKFISQTQSQYTKVSMPLSEGMHISMPQCLLRDLEMHAPAVDLPGPILVMIWTASEPQDLSFTVRMNWEFMTVNPSVPVIWRRPELVDVLTYMAANEFVARNAISSNDWHSSKIGKLASRLASDPDVRRVFSQLKSTGADALISGLMRAGTALAFL